MHCFSSRLFHFPLIFSLKTLGITALLESRVSFSLLLQSQPADCPREFLPCYSYGFFHSCRVSPLTAYNNGDKASLAGGRALQLFWKEPHYSSAHLKSHDIKHEGSRNCHRIIELPRLIGTPKDHLAQPFAGKGAQMRLSSALSNCILKTSCHQNSTTSLGRLL